MGGGCLAYFIARVLIWLSACLIFGNDIWKYLWISIKAFILFAFVGFCFLIAFTIVNFFIFGEKKETDKKEEFTPLGCFFSFVLSTPIALLLINLTFMLLNYLFIINNLPVIIGYIWIIIKYSLILFLIIFVYIFIFNKKLKKEKESVKFSKPSKEYMEQYKNIGTKKESEKIENIDNLENKQEQQQTKESETTNTEYKKEQNIEDKKQQENTPTQTK